MFLLDGHGVITQCQVHSSRAWDVADLELDFYRVLKRRECMHVCVYILLLVRCALRIVIPFVTSFSSKWIIGGLVSFEVRFLSFWYTMINNRFWVFVEGRGMLIMKSRIGRVYILKIEDGHESSARGWWWWCFAQRGFLKGHGLLEISKILVGVLYAVTHSFQFTLYINVLRSHIYEIKSKEALCFVKKNS